MKRYYKKIIAAAVSLAFLILMFMYLTGNLFSGPKIEAGREEAEKAAAAGMDIVQVKTAAIPLEVEAVGAVDARETAQVSSRVMAGITKMNVAAGDQVNKGQTLVELDARDARAQLAQARQALASAEAALERARLDTGRVERLYEKQAATKQEYDAGQASLKMAQAQVDSAKARVREAEVFLSFTKIDSPITGQVIDRMADPGDMAAPGSPLLSVYAPSSLRLEAIVPERLRPKVQLGQSVRASVDSIELLFEGQIAEIVPSSDVASRSFIIRVPLPQEHGAFPGMYGRIWIPAGSTEAILAPPRAIRRVGQLEMVTVVENGAARTRAIKTGKMYPEGIEVLSGLKPGETVAVPQRETNE
jgi:RND family efflux transporter MFP subunit